MKFTTLLAALLLLSIFPVSANQLNLVLEETWGDKPYAKTIGDGNNLYVASDGVVVLDMTIPSQPQKIAKILIDTDDSIKDIVKVGNYLYAMTSDKFFILDITNINDPKTISSIPIENSMYWRDFVIKDEQLFIAGAGNSSNSNDTFLFVYDLTNKTSPVQKTKVAIKDSNHGLITLALTGSALVTLIENEVSLLSLEENNFLNTLYTDVNTGDFFNFHQNNYDAPVIGNTVYFSMDGTLLIYDFSDSGNIKKNEMILTSEIYSLALAGSALYVNVGGSNIHSFDVSSLFTPAFISSTSLNFGGGMHLAAYDSYLIFSSFGSISIFEDMTEIGNYSYANQIYDISITGNTLVTASGDNGLFDLTSDNFSRVTRYSDRYNGKLATFNNFIYTGSKSIWNISEISSPFIAGGFNVTGGRVFDPVIVTEDVLTFASKEVVASFSLDTPEAPELIVNFELVSFFDNFEPVNTIARSDEQYFLGTSKGLFHFYRNESNEFETTGLISQEDWIRAIKIRGDYLYVVDGNGTLTLWNIENKLTPEMVSKIGLHGYNTEKFGLYESWVFIPTSSEGIVVIDISDPKFPVRLELSADIQKDLRGLEIYNNSIIAHTFSQLKRFTINKAPKIVVEVLTTNEDTAIVTKLDIENIENDELTFQITGEPSGGIASIDENGELTYQPNGNFNGADAFTFKVVDEHGGDDEQQITITVNAVNDVPVVQSNNFSVVEANVLKADLLATDIENDSLTYSLETEASSGSVVVNEDGSFEYTPNNSFTGSDSFTFIVVDHSNTPIQGTATVSVTAKAAAPPAESSSESGGGSFSWIGLLILLGLRARRTY